MKVDWGYPIKLIRQARALSYRRDVLPLPGACGAHSPLLSIQTITRWFMHASSFLLFLSFRRVGKPKSNTRSGHAHPFSPASSVHFTPFPHSCQTLTLIISADVNIEELGYIILSNIGYYLTCFLPTPARPVEGMDPGGDRPSSMLCYMTV